jgi:hypothetical protein
MTPRRIKSVDDLHAYLHRGLMLEHATIPVYLTALYSIHPGSNPAATHVLRTVAVEEMLHLTIVANLINATGGHPDLTASDFVPQFPTYLPDGETKFKVGLARFSPAALDTFLQIEQPKAAPKGALVASTEYAASGQFSLASCPLDPGVEYASIGEFYAEIQHGLDYLHERHGPSLFKPNTERQITDEYYYSGGGRLFLITNIKSAREAVRLIVEQGEGLGGGIYDHAKELAHYFRFMELKRGRYYEPGNKPEKPTGPALAVDWDKVYPIKENAKIRDYHDTELRDAAVSFNEYYAQYLARLSGAFNGQPALMLELVPMMFEIRNRMTQLMHVPLDDKSGQNAAPTFEIGVMAEAAK